MLVRNRQRVKTVTDCPVNVLISKKLKLTYIIVAVLLTVYADLNTAQFFYSMFSSTIADLDNITESTWFSFIYAPGDLIVMVAIIWVFMGCH
ncbi:hypothetical protein WICPIJ_005325 [Wickerhamomyces pijperi]|uniref:Uncharacterized protein n=1 Tax=Wickerhamomyces pijperi TaxID=599730 RepID=A0A9P8TMH1_WICPI|nr:hypothetical protein WICPIJ_005325 [Wickerhamomyces pijperi]